MFFDREEKGLRPIRLRYASDCVNLEKLNSLIKRIMLTWLTLNIPFRKTFSFPINSSSNTDIHVKKKKKIV